jgi:hypothetical protein
VIAVTLVPIPSFSFLLGVSSSFLVLIWEHIYLHIGLIPHKFSGCTGYHLLFSFGHHALFILRCTGAQVTKSFELYRWCSWHGLQVSSFEFGSHMFGFKRGMFPLNGRNMERVHHNLKKKLCSIDAHALTCLKPVSKLTLPLLSCASCSQVLWVIWLRSSHMI